MAKYSSFEEMDVYQKALAFAVKIYRLTMTNEDIKSDFGLRDQLRRAALSISNNIAEGFERETKKELIRFLYFSKGSSGESRNMINFLHAIDFIDDNNFKEYKDEIIEVSKQLANYIKYLKKLEKENKAEKQRK